METISVISVVTNAGLIVFTMNTLDEYNFSMYGKMWVFVGFQWVLLIIQTILRWLVAEKPNFVTIQENRSEYIKSKLIDKVVEEDDENVLNARKLMDISYKTSRIQIKKDAPGE